MFSTDNLFFLIVFVIPGSFYLLFNRYLRAVPTIEKDETVRLSGALMFSFVVFAIISLVLENLYAQLFSQDTIFCDTKLLLLAVTSNIVLSFIICLLWATIKPWVITTPVNIVNKVLKRPIETRSELLWNCLFEDGNLIDTDCCIVTIEKDGLTTSGQIVGFPASVTEKTDLILSNTQIIERLLERDKSKEEGGKIFGKVSYVYVDVANGLKITFYDSGNYKTIYY